MLDNSFSTRREIWEAKKLMYEGDKNTKNSFNIVLLSIICTLVLLVFSFAGTVDSWDCTLDDSSPKNKFVCSEVRRIVNCKTVAGPINGKVILNVNDSINATAEVNKYYKKEITCPWETAVSELRVCFIFMSLICVVIAFVALKKEDKKYAEFHVASALFLWYQKQLSLIFNKNKTISGIFDYFSIQNSIVNNYNYCNLKDEFSVDENTKAQVDCGFTFFYLTVVIELVCAVCIFFSGVYVNKWKRALVKDSSSI